MNINTWSKFANQFKYDKQLLHVDHSLYYRTLPIWWKELVRTLKHVNNYYKVIATNVEYSLYNRTPPTWWNELIRTLKRVNNYDIVQYSNTFFNAWNSNKPLAFFGNQLEIRLHTQLEQRNLTKTSKVTMDTEKKWPWQSRGQQPHNV